MGDDVKIVGEAGKDATISVIRGCGGQCPEQPPAPKWVFTPVNFKYKAKVKFKYNKDGVEDGEALKFTPLGDVSATYSLSNIGEIKKGAVGKDAAAELKGHYNSIKQPQAPEMEDSTAKLIVDEFHKELKKSSWKTFFEKGIKNSLKTENIVAERVMDLASKKYVEEAHHKGISLKGWTSHSSFEKEYEVNVNVGVNPLFLSTCSNPENKSRLTVSDPVLKECKMFIAGLNEENDNLFSFEVKEPYEGDDGFEPGSSLQRMADEERFLEPSNRAWMAATAKKIQEQHYMQGLAEAAAGSSFFEYNEEKQTINAGGKIGDVRVGVDSMLMANSNNSWEARQDIYVGFNFEYGQHHIGLKSINLGGKKANIAYALQRMAANLSGWAYQVWLSWHRSKSKGDEVTNNAEKLKEETDEQAVVAEDMADKADELQQKVEAAAGATSQEDMANKLNAAQNAQAEAQSSGQNLDTAESKVATNPGVNSNANTANVDQVRQTVSQIAEPLATAQTLNNQGDLPGAKSVVSNQALPKAQELVSEANTAKDKAIEQNQAAEDHEAVVKALIQKQSLGPNGNEDSKDNMEKDIAVNQGSLQASEANMGALAKGIADSNSTGITDAIEKITLPALGPTQSATPQEKAVDKTDLQGNTPKVETGVNGDAKGGEGFKSQTAQEVDPVALGGTIGKTEKEEGQLGGAQAGEGYWVHSKNNPSFNPDAAEVVYKISQPAEANEKLKDTAQNESPIGTCWIAREVYGIEDGKWLEFRSWLLNSASDLIRNSYIKYGQTIAKFIKNKPILKRIIKIWMNSKINEK